MVENYMINPVTMFFLNLALSRQVYGDINVGLYKLGGGGNKNTLLLIFFFNFITWSLNWAPLFLGSALDFEVAQVHKAESVSLRI